MAVSKARVALGALVAAILAVPVVLFLLPGDASDNDGNDAVAIATDQDGAPDPAATGSVGAALQDAAETRPSTSTDEQSGTGLTAATEDAAASDPARAVGADAGGPEDLPEGARDGREADGEASGADPAIDDVASVPNDEDTTGRDPSGPQEATTERPAIDSMRVEPDGLLTLAGTGTPGQALAILVGGAEVERLTIDPDGTWAAVIFLDPSEDARALRILADPEGEAIAADTALMIAPTVPQTPLIIAGGGLALGEMPGPAGPGNGPETEDDTAGRSDDGSVVAETDQSGDTAANDNEARAAAAEEASPSESGSAGVAEVSDQTSISQDADSGDAAAGEAVVVQAGPETSADGAPPGKGTPSATADKAVARTDDADAPAIEPDADDDATGLALAGSAGGASSPSDIATSAPQASPPLEIAAADPPAPAPRQDPSTEAPGGPVLLATDGDDVRVIRSAPPEVMSNVALDTITYDPEGEVVLAGRAAAGNFVQVYIDNEPVTTSRIGAEGDWRLDLPEVDTGIYTLRIDETDAEGDVVSRIETPFKREDAETVAAVMADQTSAPGFDIATRTVQRGMTLWAIAEEELGEGIRYVAVYEANSDLIRDPDLIYPGQVFRIPLLPER